MRYIAAFTFFFISIFAIMFYMAGMHGHLMFRPQMKEDWIIWGIAVLSLITGLILLTKGTKKHYT